MQQQQLAPAAFFSVKLVVGVFFAAVGLLATLGNLDLIDADVYLRYWPAVLILIGLLKIGDPATRLPGSVALIAGVVLLALTTRLLRLSLVELWPLLLIGGGVVLVLQAFGIRVRPRNDGTTIWGVLTNQRVEITARDFRGVRAFSFLGGSTIDLTAAQMTQSAAVIDVFVLMGGVELRVPDDWHVVTEAVPFMGGIEMNTRSTHSTKQLIVRGFVMMGGIDIKDGAARTV